MRLLGKDVQWWHLALAAGGLLLLTEGEDIVEGAVDVIRDFVTRGKRLTVSPRMVNNQVPTYPVDLLAEAQATLGREISMDAYALARMIRAEGGGGPVPEKQARAWVAVNDSRAHGWSMLYTIAGPDFLFGQQRGWRYASGRDERTGGTVDPYENDLNVAEAVLTGELPDNTGGATKFVDIDSFGVQPGTGTYEETAAKWRRESGLEPFEVEGAQPVFRVFRRVG